MKNHGFLGSLIYTATLLASCANNELADKSVVQKKAEIYYGQGTNDLVKKNYSQALINLLKAREYDPKDSLIRNNLGMAYYFREQPELAEKELIKAIDLDNNNTEAMANLGTIYMERNRLKEARDLFTQVSQNLTYMAQFRNYYNFALLALKEGDRKEAFDFLNKSIKEKEDYCQAHFKLGELYTEEYKFKQALASFQESSKGTCVIEPAPFYQQALSLINLNRFEEARLKLKEIIEKFPKTRFHSLANQQLRNITGQQREQASGKIFQTEIIKESKTITSPNF
ncbi:MAG: tetratricopeptide repeat protein [Bacteriovorax sp.]|jgi:type IV pilus assembly protein PilF|nr:tetratricopeptide repeat protein [Bacteriovorax sp.]